MCGVSGLIWMPLVNSWGRIPVLFWSCFLGIMFTLGCILAPTYTTYYAMRGLQCVNQSTGQTIGLAFVEDIFFYHQYARKIGIWYTLFLCAPFFSPMVGNFMLAKLGDWRPMFWLSFACSTTLLACIFFFGDETYYNRSIPPERQKRRPRSQRILRVLGIWQLTDLLGISPPSLPATVASSKFYSSGHSDDHDILQHHLHVESRHYHLVIHPPQPPCDRRWVWTQFIDLSIYVLHPPRCPCFLEKPLGIFSTTSSPRNTR